MPYLWLSRFRFARCLILTSCIHAFIHYIIHANIYSHFTHFTHFVKFTHFVIWFGMKKCSLWTSSCWPGRRKSIVWSLCPKGFTGTEYSRRLEDLLGIGPLGWARFAGPWKGSWKAWGSWLLWCPFWWLLALKLLSFKKLFCIIRLMMIETLYCNPSIH